MGLLILAVFWNLSANDPVTVMGLIGALYFILQNWMILIVMGTVLIFHEERPVFLRELANKMYVVSPYYLAKVMTEFPLLVITLLLMQIIIYFGIGLTVTVVKFFYFYLVLFLLTMASSAIGYFFSSVFTQPEAATELTPIIMMPMFLFGGLFTNVDTYPIWIRWF
jgi:hypothetical protein